MDLLARNYSFHRLTSNNTRLRKVLQEHYLRSDIHCGFRACKECTQYSHVSEQPTPLMIQKPCLILDLGIVLRHMHVLEAAKNVLPQMVILQAVLEEVRQQNYKLYRRLKEFMLNRNDYVFMNEHHRSTYVDRDSDANEATRSESVVRVACVWYCNHLPKNSQIVMVSDDNETRLKATAEGVPSCSLEEVIKTMLTINNNNEKQQSLIDMVHTSSEEVLESDIKKLVEYEQHLTDRELRNKPSYLVKQGVFQVERSYYRQGYVKISGSHKRIIVADMPRMNRAIHGDTVAIELLPCNEWVEPDTEMERQVDDDDDVENDVDKTYIDNTNNNIELKNDKVRPTGKIVSIIQRNSRTYSGSIQDTDMQSGHVLFVPVDRKIPKIRIRSSNIQTLIRKRIRVTIDGWSRRSMYPNGHYIEIIGTIGEKEVEIQVLLDEYDIRSKPFSPAVLACTPKEDYIISEDEMRGRRDLRQSHCIVSIDPPGCTDIDDALHARLLPNGNYEVGVHIADVSHYMKPGSAMDEEASIRGTSVYLVDRRIDMIPGILSGNICSLRPNVDRLVFSVIWEMTPDAEIIKTDFFKGIIHSKKAFTYEQAQAVIDDKTQTDDIAMAVRYLDMLSYKMKEQRRENGSMELSAPTVKFELDADNKNVIGMRPYRMFTTNRLVEEFMLLANTSVGTFTMMKFPRMALLRRHPVPPEDRFRALQLVANKFGIKLNIESNKSLARSLDRATLSNFPQFNELLRSLTIMSMTQAKYFVSGEVESKQFYHYGLALSVYTHFTSPIRRYADVIVHRLLAAAIEVETLHSSMQDHERICDIVQNLNLRKHSADLVSRASNELFMFKYFQQHQNTVEDAIVIDVRSNGIRIKMPKYAISGRIELLKTESDLSILTQFKEKDPDNMNDDAIVNSMEEKYYFDEENLTLTSRNRKISLFDSVKVHVSTKKSADNLREWCHFELWDGDDKNNDDAMMEKKKKTSRTKRKL